MLLLIRHLAHAITTIPSLFETVLKAILTLLTTNSSPQPSDAYAAETFAILCKQGSTVPSLCPLFCFSCCRFSNLDQLLSIDIGHLRQSVVPSFLEGCCSAATQLGDVRSSWFIAQLQKARCFPDLSALKVLLTNTQLFASSPTIEFVNEFKEVSNYLCILRGTAEKDEFDELVFLLSARQGMDVWKDCVSSVLHTLIQIDPASLASVSEMLLEGIQNSGNAVFMTLFGDLLVTSATCNL